MAIRVLLIDPDITFMVSTKQALEGTGEFVVSVSANAVAAEDTLQRDRHDIVVLAFDLPDRDVVKLIAQLRHIQPGIPVILCPQTHDHQERVRFIDAQGAIQRPYAARDLIPYIRSVLTRTRRAPLPAAPEPADVLEELETIERSRTTYLSDETDDPDALTKVLDWEDAGPAHAADHPDSLDDLLEQHGWVDRGPVTRPLPPREDEPPLQPDDTRDVPTQDSPAIRQLLATERQDEDLSDFGDVLDAVAHAPGDEGLSPDDRAFHDLVDSMREPPPPPVPRSSLENLLISLAEDSARRAESGEEPPENALDQVLDAIRRGISMSPLDESAPVGSEQDGTTIGDAIGGLFDPAFEGVLAALSGEDVTEDELDEPTYSPQAREGVPGSDRYGFGDLIGDDDRPSWLADYEAGEIEPPFQLEDSRHYPATAALNAVTGPGEDNRATLDGLLSQIEQILPPPQPTLPRLEPLPSWGQDVPAGDRQLAALFDQAEGITPEPPVVAQDTRPSQAMRDEIDGVDVQNTDTQPLGPDIEALDEQDWPDEAAEEQDWPVEAAGEQSWPHEAAGDQDAPEQPPDRVDEDYREALARLTFEELIEPGDAASYEEVDERARYDAPDEIAPYEAVVERAWYGEPGDAAPYEEADERARYDVPDEIAPYEEVDERAWYGEPDDAAPAGEAGDLAFFDEPDDSHLVPVPVETVAQLLSREIEAEDDLFGDGDEAEIAAIAVQLTQFSLESMAQATMISRPGCLLAQAGELPESTISRLFDVIDSAWQSSPPDSDSLIRFTALPDAGEFLLYSILVEDGMALSMVFHATMPIGQIRRQARRLSESLALVPEEEAAAPVIAPEAEAEPEPSPTLPSRPTDLHPPEGLYEAVQEELVKRTAQETERPPRPEGPVVGYSALWLPFDPGLELLGDFADAVYQWILDIAEENAWDVDALDIRPDYVEIALNVPQKTLPDSALALLMDETARRSAAYFPDIVSDSRPLWADGFYLVMPPRALTEREIARFMHYQRETSRFGLG